MKDIINYQEYFKNLKETSYKLTEFKEWLDKEIEDAEKCYETNDSKVLVGWLYALLMVQGKIIEREL
jgi:hypothetical protein